MNPSSIARRYAKALFELAAEDGLLEQTGQELAALRQALEADPQLEVALRSPSTTREERTGVAEALVKGLKPGPTLANMLRLLAERGRLADLPAIERVYRDLADERAGRVRARVVSAVPLSEEMAGQMVAALTGATGKNVVVERAVDPSILGGAVAQVGSQVFDGSIRNQIAQLKQQLKA
ncbi:MAG: F0F1 ATP synthase subunit delta [Deltaproteobacteria bacterium]|nr:F0F1 ATP synthase subunit delta [Deltaproteobacteria bacterium]